MTALLSLAPVVAACYLLATLKGHAVLLLFLAASLAWCAWAVMRERRCAHLERLARFAEHDSTLEFDDDDFDLAEPSPAVSHPPAQLPDFLVVRHSARTERPVMAHSRVASAPPPAVQDTWRQSPGADRVRSFPIHKLSR